jgi:hypothetical protein
VDAYLLQLRGELLDFIDSHRTGLVFALANPDKPGFRGVGTTNSITMAKTIALSLSLEKYA